jgi:hypothetical protein
VSLISGGWSSVLSFFVHRVELAVPALAPAKALRSDVSAPTRRCSSIGPWEAGSASVTGEPPRGIAVAMGSQQEAAAVEAATAVATTVTMVPPVPAPTAGGRAAVVDIPDDDTPPPGSGQWENWPTLAPELAARTHGAEASTSRAALPAPDAIVMRPEQERGHASVPPAHFDEAQAE